MDQVRIFALGGLDENGKNMYVVEVNEAIFIIEAGLKYPESDQLGGIHHTGFLLSDSKQGQDQRDFYHACA